MPYIASMRTTLAIDDDVLAMARAIAERDQRSLGQVVTELARKGIRSQTPAATSQGGFPVLPRRGVVVTLELVNTLRDEE
jgi:hypothetical protein